MLQTPTNPSFTATIVAAVIAGLFGGTGGAILTYFLSKRKNQAEIENLNAAAQKSRAETDKIIAELKGVSAEVSYGLASSAEQILFDGTAGIDGFDVRGNQGSFWKGFGAEAKATSPKGLGELKFEGAGVLNIQRTNKDGRFELWFQRYTYRGTTELGTIPKDDLISGKRKVRVSCEAKVSGIEHSLRFLLREQNGTRLAEQIVAVKSREWAQFQVFLSADPKDCVLRIDDEIDPNGPLPAGSVQIRKIVVAQRN